MQSTDRLEHELSVEDNVVAVVDSGSSLDGSQVTLTATSADSAFIIDYQHTLLLLRREWHLLYPCHCEVAVIHHV